MIGPLSREQPVEESEPRCKILSFSRGRLAPPRHRGQGVIPATGGEAETRVSQPEANSDKSTSPSLKNKLNTKRLGE